MKRILISTSSFAVESKKPLELLQQAGFEVTLNPFGRKLSKEETVNLLRDKDGVIAGTESYSDDVLRQLASLKVISRCGAGTDGIDLKGLSERQIALLSTPEVHITAVAELALAGLLSVARKIPQGDALMKKGKWEKLMGTNLSGKTVGIIGFGKVGRLFSEMLKPFGCHCIVYDPFLDRPVPPSLKRVDNLDSLLKDADVISLHLPVTAESKNIISATALTQVKKDVIILNTARGGLVDESALCDFLTQNESASAYLDVFDKEPYQGPLATLPNLVLSPHVGTFTRETRVQMETESVMNLIKFFTNHG